MTFHWFIQAFKLIGTSLLFRTVVSLDLPWQRGAASVTSYQCGWARWESLYFCFTFIFLLDSCIFICTFMVVFLSFCIYLSKYNLQMIWRLFSWRIQNQFSRDVGLTPVSKNEASVVMRASNFWLFMNNSFNYWSCRFY